MVGVLGVRVLDLHFSVVTTEKQHDHVQIQNRLKEDLLVREAKRKVAQLPGGATLHLLGG